MGRLYELAMRATDSETATLKATSAAQGAARIANNAGHAGLAAAAAAGAALVVAADTMLHAPKAAPGIYATFHTDKTRKDRS